MRENLRVWLDRMAMTQREFAKRMTKSQPWLQKILDGENDLRLDDLDDVATILQIPTAELVRAKDDALVELRPSEMAIVRMFRQLPPDLELHVSEVIRKLHEGLQKSSGKNLKATDVLENTASMTGRIDAGETTRVPLAAQLAAVAAQLTVLSKRVAEVETNPAHRRDAATPRRPKSGNR